MGKRKTVKSNGLSPTQAVKLTEIYRIIITFCGNAIEASTNLKKVLAQEDILPTQDDAIFETISWIENFHTGLASTCIRRLGEIEESIQRYMIAATKGKSRV